MKIGIINNLYPPFDRGGAEKIAYQQAQELGQQGHQVFIITTKDHRQLSQENQEKIYYFHSRYQSLAKIPKTLRLFWHLGQFIQPLSKGKIKKIIEVEQPDLIITHNLLGLGWRWPLIIKNLGIKQQHVLHDIQLLHPSGLLMAGQEKIINSWPAKIYQAILRYYFRFVTQVKSPSSWLLKLHQEKNFWLQTSTEIKRFSTANIKSISWPKEIKKILFVGQLESHKGVLFLLEWAQTWLPANYNLSLSLVGDGSLKEAVISASQANPRIKFLGKLKTAAVVEAMKNHDCLIVPSICHENSPTVVFEANQVNLPTIAAAVGGLPELANAFNLKLFPAGDKLALEKIIFNK